MNRWAVSPRYGFITLFERRCVQKRPGTSATLELRELLINPSRGDADQRSACGQIRVLGIQPKDKKGSYRGKPGRSSSAAPCRNHKAPRRPTNKRSVLSLHCEQQPHGGPERLAGGKMWPVDALIDEAVGQDCVRSGSRPTLTPTVGGSPLQRIFTVCLSDPSRRVRLMAEPTRCARKTSVHYRTLRKTWGAFTDQAPRDTSSSLCVSKTASHLVEPLSCNTWSSQRHERRPRSEPWKDAQKGRGLEETPSSHLHTCRTAAE